MSLAWQDLTFQGGDTLWKTLLQYCCCRIPKKRSRAPILNNLSGSIFQKKLIALMGPSGAGKSTFFNCLAKGKHHGGFSGHIWVKCDAVAGQLGTSYLTQHADEHLLMNLTVMESLLYASKLKNPHFNSGSKHQDVVEALIVVLNLVEVKNKFAELCSGGQKKRLAIGLELAAEKKPQFLILDEPLSGLDSFCGLEVIKLLSKFSKEYNMATVVTIHQPSYEILAIFDQVYVISKRGNCIYNNKPGGLVNFLTTHGYNGRRNDNPADNIIKVASSVERDKADEAPQANDEERGVDEMISHLQQVCKKMGDTVQNFAQQHPVSPTEESVDMSESGICQNRTDFRLGALVTLFKRSFYTSLWRQKKLIMIRALLHLVVAGVLAGLYSRDMEVGLESGCFVPNGYDPKNCSCIPTEADLRNETKPTQNVKFQFFSLLFLMFAALMPTVLTFPAEIKLFLNEHRNGWYTTSSYYISKTIIEIPIQLFLSGGYTLFLYWHSQQIGIDMSHWYLGWRYYHFQSVTWMSCFIAQGLGFLIGIACVNSFSISVILSSSVLLFLFLFSGFFVKVVQMSVYVSWITSLSFIRFAFESLLVVLYGYNRCNVPTESIILFTFDLKDSNYEVNWAWLIVHLFVTRILAFICLKSRADPNFLTIKETQVFVKELTRRLTPLCSTLGGWIFYAIKVIMILFLLQLVIALIVGAFIVKNNTHQ